MLFTLWPRKQAPRSASKARRTTKPAGRHGTFRPQLDALEDRCVPSTLKVTNTDDFGNPGSLRYEIAQAKSGDTITFDSELSNQTITLISGELAIDKSLTIKGQNETINSYPYFNGLLENLPGSRIFDVGAGTTVAISGLTIDGGGGTCVGDGGVGVIGTPYDGYGGAILNFGTLTLSGCSLGAAVNVPVQYNSAQWGGAIANFGTMTVSSCFIGGNSAYGGYINRTFFPGEGGGIYNAGTLTVSHCTFSYNVAVTDGGAIDNAGGLTVSNSVFSGNIAGGYPPSGFGGKNNISGFYTDGGGNIFN
jgi:predicted outer membrane repeat protein